MSLTPRNFASKRAAEVEDREIFWGGGALPAGDTIATSSWSVSPAGLTLSSPSFANTPQILARVRIAAGTQGVDYLLTNTITTASGLTLIESGSITIT